jgi:LPS-assembly lipoprotein
MKKYLSIVFLMFTLAACGFHLRGYVDMPEHLKTIYVSPDDPYNPMQRELRSALRLSGVTVADSPTGVYTLRLLGENYTTNDLIIGSDGLVKQQQMNLILRYQIVPPEGEPFPEQTASTQRDLNVDENQILGQNQEERILLQEMRIDLAQQMLRRLRAIPAE